MIYQKTLYPGSLTRGWFVCVCVWTELVCVEEGGEAWHDLLEERGDRAAEAAHQEAVRDHQGEGGADDCKGGGAVVRGT